jgi:aldehyde:ferredoxin oxidoreductase
MRERDLRQTVPLLQEIFSVRDYWVIALEDDFREVNRAGIEAGIEEVAKARRKYGTPLTLNITHMGGILPTKNFSMAPGRRPWKTSD